MTQRALGHIPTPSASFFASWATLLKKSLIATERRRAKVKRQREGWFKHRVPAVSKHPVRIVSIDETSTKANLTRQRGWARFGNRQIMDAPFGSWGTQTFRAGLSAEAMVAPWVIKGAMPIGECKHSTAGSRWPRFRRFPRKSVGVGTLPGTVVIRDNLATHKNAEAEKAMRRAGFGFSFPPPYSPDLNPIEMAFSKLKAHLCRIGARTFNDMFNAIAEICDLYSTDECWS